MSRSASICTHTSAPVSKAWAKPARYWTGGWTPRDVVGHLISAELDDWIPRAETILDHGTDRAFDPFDRFAHVERDAGVPLASLIDRFEELRALLAP